MSMGISGGTALAVGGGMLLGGILGGKGGAPATDPGIGQAAQANAKVAADTLDWYKAKDAEMKPARDEATKIALEQANIQTDTARKQNAMADETYAYTKDTFRPLEQKIATDALGYDTAARRDTESAQAQADVGSAADAGRANLEREIQSRGGDVNSGNFTASLANAGVREAAVKAGAGNLARKNVEAVGAAKLADAANLGRGIASTNATQTQLGLQAGNSAVVNSQVPGNIATQQGNMVAQGAGTAINANSSAGNLLLGQYNAQTGADQAANSTTNALLGAVGQGAGAYFGATSDKTIKPSDKTIKHDRKKISGKVSLAQVKKLPANETWRYNKGSVADDGGKLHEGHMAQDVNKVMGEEAAPKGKMINLEHMAATGLAAIKEVAKGQEKMHRRILRLEDVKRRA